MSRVISAIAGLVLLIGGVSTPAIGAAADSPLRMATFVSDATLPLGDILYSETLKTIEHPLLAKGVVLDDGQRRYVLCVVDWCTMRNATHVQFQTKIAAAAATSPESVAVQCVHQHTAPTFDASAEQLLRQQADPLTYRNLKSLDEITDRLAAAVRQALDRLQPFDTVGIGQAKVDRVAATRRVLTAEGRVLTRWSSCRDPALRAMPEGDIDPLLRTISLLAGDKPLVRMHYYATHPQTHYLNGRASYDFPGMARERLEQEEGVFQMYFTGCAGDVTVGKYNAGTPEDRAALAERLFAGMKASITATQTSPVARIAWRTEPVTLAPRSDGARDPEQNRRIVADPNAKTAERVQAASRLACQTRLREPIVLSLLELGPARVLHLPGEPLIAFQHFACGLQPDRFLAVAGYGLGTPGYICPQRAFAEGGYEPSASAVVPESESVLQAAIRRLLGSP